ncbi:MAG: orotidine-5'-phosphate decarboxylase [Candidatus Binataceae bacterium]
MTQYWPFSGLLRHGAPRERLIVSLDNVERNEALRIVDRLTDVVGMFKVGRALFLGGGADFVREMRRRGAEVFLDLKFRDYPQNVVRAAIEATRLGAKMFDIQPNGNLELMTRTRIGVSRVCRSEGLRRPHILTVAMVACIRPEAGENHSPENGDSVVRLAKLTSEAAFDGVFTPAKEARRVRDGCGRRFIIVASGVHTRETGEPLALSAADAIRAGADYVVVGGPICQAAEPLRVVREITEDVERGLHANGRVAIELFPPRLGLDCL